MTRTDDLITDINDHTQASRNGIARLKADFRLMKWMLTCWLLTLTILLGKAFTS